MDITINNQRLTVDWAAGGTHSGPQQHEAGPFTKKKALRKLTQLTKLFYNNNASSSCT